MSREHFIGLMSGTSLDGVDAVAVAFGDAAPTLLAAAAVPFPADLRARLLALNQAGPDELDRSHRAGIELARHYAQAVSETLRAAGLSPADILAIGCHGQTVRHRPDLGYTVQIGSPAWLAQLTGITVVADFRSRDIAAGGQGAPLVPAFHRSMFASDVHRVIVNIGGISNLTDLDPSGPVRGFDCGPGNLLMDGWMMRHRGQPYDHGGAWGATGRVSRSLLEALLAHPFLARTPPRSTGRDDFHLAWLDEVLADRQLSPQDVQATLQEFTVAAIADSIGRFCPGTREVYLCGGGARNAVLAARLGARLPRCALRTTDDLGVDARHVEAMAFAWLARRTLRGEPGNLPAVTGAAVDVVLGAIYPA